MYKKKISLASTPELIISITLIVMFGAFFGAMGYLTTKPSEDNIPIISFPRINNPIKKEIEAVITTDKTEYEQGEIMRIALKNNSKQSIFSIAAGVIPEFSITSIEKQKPDKTWEKFPVRCTWPECDIDFDNPSELKAGQAIIFSWMPTMHIDSKNVLLEQGTYRFGIDYQIIKNQGWLQIYSSEFTIKEKIATDPKCSQKVTFSDTPNCPLSRIVYGYEFDLAAKECKEVEVYGGCSFETPFDTLEECRKICKKSQADFYSCDQNSDCVKTTSDCCGCNAGGKNISINKNYEKEWKDKLAKECKDTSCPAVMSNDPSCFAESKCVNNKCILE